MHKVTRYKQVLIVSVKWRRHGSVFPRVAVELMLALEPTLELTQRLEQSDERLSGYLMEYQGWDGLLS